MDNIKKTEDILLPCPFCGGEAYFERIGDRRQSEIVRCEDCGCSLESSNTGGLKTTDWNNRFPEIKK